MVNRGVVAGVVIVLRRSVWSAFQEDRGCAPARFGPVICEGVVQVMGCDGRRCGGDRHALAMPVGTACQAHEYQQLLALLAWVQLRATSDSSP